MPSWNYSAVYPRKQVKRGMKAADARKLCPELSLVQVPTRNGKADISLYRCARICRAGNLAA